MRGQPLIVAHRGGAALWPENTLEAITGAIQLSVDAIEIDVQQTKDGVPVVLHDEMLDRTTVESGSIKDVHSRDLKDIRLKDLQGNLTEQTLPSLADALELFSKSPSSMLSLELKNDDAGEPYPNAVKNILKTLDDAHFKNDIFFHGFDWHLLGELKSTLKTAHAGVNIEWAQWNQLNGNHEALMDQIFASQISHFNFDATILRETNWQEWHQARSDVERAALRFSVWTVNANNELDFWFKEPVWGIATDRPHVAVERFK